MKQPKTAAQQQLQSIDTGGKTVVDIPRSKDKVSVGWLKPYTTHRFSKEYLKAEIPSDTTDKQQLMLILGKPNLAYKLASYLILNNFWSIKFFHWIYWRWLAFVKQYDDDQLAGIIIEGKKKMTVESRFLIMGFSALILETMMNQTKKEAEQWRAELMSAFDQPSEKSTPGL